MLPTGGQAPDARRPRPYAQIIENRVNATGVAEPWSAQGSDRIIVELPGVDADEIRNLVGQTGQLHFVPLGRPTAR